MGVYNYGYKNETIRTVSNSDESITLLWLTNSSSGDNSSDKH